MSCNFPNKMFRIGVKDNGKNDLLFCNSNVHHLEYFKNTWYRVYTPYTSPKAEKLCFEYIDVPCGTCMDCRLSHSRDWANRCLMEMAYHSVNMFITLTYDDEHLHYVDHYTDNGKLVVINTLVKKDLSDFIKRLRKYFDDSETKIRYFACGEYGEHTYRPHYHLIIFGAIVPDLKLHSQSTTGKVYTSEILANIWKNGNVLVAEANYNTAAYTARYVVKKANGGNNDYIRKYGIVPEFVTMSRKPGIGAWYFDDHDVFKNEHIVIGTEQGSKRFKPPRYFQKLLEKQDPERFKEYKEKNIIFAKISSDVQGHATDLDQADYAKVRDDNLRKRVKGLERRKN